MTCVVVNSVLLNMKENKMSWNPTEYLKTLHTKQLMNLRHDALAYGGAVDCLRGGLIGQSTATINDINAELNTREHVPNKQEAKALRQKQAKEKRNR